MLLLEGATSQAKDESEKECQRGFGTWKYLGLHYRSTTTVHLSLTRHLTCVHLRAFFILSLSSFSATFSLFC